MKKTLFAHHYMQLQMLSRQTELTVQYQNESHHW